jgi:hypothetical protein
LSQLGEHRRLGRLEHAVEAAQHGEGQDDLAVLGLLVVAAEEVGDGPDEGGEVRVDPIARDREGAFVMCFADRLPELYRRGRAGQARRDRRLDL